MLLSKGFEVEMYTGNSEGEIVGLSDRIVNNLPGFVREPDSRNVEYVTPPLYKYEQLLCALLQPRLQLRKYLKGLGDYTIVPGSTLSLGNSDRFLRSDPDNDYHSYIEQTYGTKVVTASVHINVGIGDPELLMQACRLIRVEAPLFLALTASSPFLDGAATGYHSTRWQLFPKTPAHVPLFESHAHYIDWTNAQLEAGTMQNVRHLWSSVRPNGDRRPHDLNRLELRICDLAIDPITLLAVMAFLEARIAQMLHNPSLDPLRSSQLPAASRHEDLIAITEANEKAVAKSSLDAQLQHWVDGSSIRARDWILDLYQEVFPYAKQGGYSCFLLPLKKILVCGNQAQQWLSLVEQGYSVSEIIQRSIATAARQEQEQIEHLCKTPAALLA